MHSIHSLIFTSEIFSKFISNICSLLITAYFTVLKRYNIMTALHTVRFIKFIRHFIHTFNYIIKINACSSIKLVRRFFGIHDITYDLLF